MEHERGSSKHLRELERRDAVKHGHERPTEEDYDTVDFTPAEGRMLIRFLRTSAIRTQNDVLHLT